jgi:hypothetical protein
MFNKVLLYNAAAEISTSTAFRKGDNFASMTGEFVALGSGGVSPTSDLDNDSKVQEEYRDDLTRGTFQDLTNGASIKIKVPGKDEVDIYSGEELLEKGFTKGIVTSCLPTSRNIINDNIGNPERISTPSVAFYLHKSDAKGLPRRDAEVVSAFMSGIPTLEMSRCVPYLDLTLVSLEDKFKKGQESRKISLVRFLGDKLETDIIANAAPADIGDLPTNLSKRNLYTGMEVFTSPQTLVNPNNSSGLNKFLPFLTLNSCDIRTVSAGQGFYSYKTASIKLTLHDRTRMREISPLIAVDQFSQNYIVLEYGWSHPDGGPGSRNAYGVLMNNMRCRETYSLVSSNFSTSAESAGAVTITLNLAMMPGEQARGISAAAGEQVQLSLVKSALMSVLRQQSSESESEDVAKKMKIKTKNVSFAGSMVPRASLVSLIKILEAEQFSETAFTEASNEIINLLDTPKAVNESTDIQTQLIEKRKEITTNLSKSDFSARLGTIMTARKQAQGDKSDETYIPLSTIVYAYLAYPLATSCRFDEIQVHFYPMNKNALYASAINIGDMPVPLSVLDEALSKLSNPSGQSLVNYIIDQTLSRPDFFYYGLNDLYAKKEAIVKESDAKIESTTKELKAAKTESEKANKFVQTQSGNSASSRFSFSGVSSNVTGEAPKPNSPYSLAANTSATEGTGRYANLAKGFRNTDAITDESVKADVKQKELDEARRQKEVAVSKIDQDIEDRIQEIAKAVQMPSDEFLVPDIRIYVESTGMVDQNGKKTSKILAKVHIFDKSSSPYFGQQIVLKSITSGDIISTYDKFVPQIKDGNGKSVSKLIPGNEASAIIGNFNERVIKDIIAATVPTITIGNEFSMVTSLSVSANTQGNLADTLMLEAIKNAKDPSISKAGSSNIDDITVIPSTMSVTMTGMPVMQYGQQFFVDLQTGTNTDNIYVVTSVNHSITPEGFTTSLSLTPSFQGSIKSFKTALRAAVTKLTKKEVVSEAG